MVGRTRCLAVRRPARIVQAQSLTDADISELVALCKSGRTDGLAEGASVADPLAAFHFPAVPSAGASVCLTAVEDVSAVNGLAPGQTLSFGPTGMTVVYGDNGAGKSGYARLLKRARRARHSEAILSNVYEAPAATAASATLSYSVGGLEQPPEPWQDTGNREPQPHPILSAISVFDAECGTVHLKGGNDVALRPSGLDVPDELASACKKVKAALDAEVTVLRATRNAIFNSAPWSATTAVGKAIAALTQQERCRRLRDPRGHDGGRAGSARAPDGRSGQEPDGRGGRTEGQG